MVNTKPVQYCTRRTLQRCLIKYSWHRNVLDVIKLDR